MTDGNAYIVYVCDTVELVEATWAVIVPVAYELIPSVLNTRP